VYTNKVGVCYDNGYILDILEIINYQTQDCFCRLYCTFNQTTQTHSVINQYIVET